MRRGQIIGQRQAGGLGRVHAGTDEEERQHRTQRELQKLFRSAAIDFIQLRTDQPYAIELAKFFETREKRRARG